MRDFRHLEPIDYLEIFWRRKWYFVLAWIAVSTAAAAYASRAPLRYTSETRILIQQAVIPEDYVRPTVRATPDERINALRSQLESRSFLERIVEEMQLFGFGSEPGFVMEAAVDALRRSVQLRPAGASVASLSFTATDPQFAREVTKRMATALIQTNTASRRNLATETDQFIDNLRRQAQDELAAQDEKIKQFKMRHLGELPEQTTINLNAIGTLNTQLAAVDNELQQIREQMRLLDFRAQEQKRLSILSQSLLPGETGAAPDIPSPKAPSAIEGQLVAKKAQLAELAARYTTKHPDYDRLKREVEDLEKRAAAEKAGEEKLTPMLTPLGEQVSEAREVPAKQQTSDFLPLTEIAEAELRLEEEQLKNRLAERQKVRDEIVRQIQAYQSKLNMAPALEQEYLALTRERELLLQRYNNLQVKKFNAQMAAALETDANNETYKIIDEANLPLRPAFPNRWQIVLIGIGAGFAAGIVAVFGREYLDPTISRDEEVVPVLGLPLLASIPEIRASEARIRKTLPRKTGAA